MATPVGAALYGLNPGIIGTHAGADFTFAVGAADEYEITFAATKSGDIDTFALFCQSATGAGRTLEALITGIDANGNSDGVAAGGGAAYALDCTSTGWKTGTGGTPFTLVAGTTYALLVRDQGPEAGTCAIRASFSMTSGDAMRIGAAALQNGTVSGGAQPKVFMAYDDGDSPSYVTDGQAIESITPASNPDERGVAFTVPVTMTAIGLLITLQFQAASGAEITLYDSDGSSVLEQWTTLDENYASGRDTWTLMFTGDRTFTPGSTYRIAVIATAGTVDLWVIEFDNDVLLKNSALMDVRNFQRTTQNGGGGWTETSVADMPEISLIVKSFTLGPPPVDPGCSAASASYGAWTRTGPLNTPWRLTALATDGDNPVAAYELWTGAARTGTQVDSGAASSATPISGDVAYDASGLVDGDQTLYFSVDDGLGNISSDCTFTLRRDDIDPTEATGVSVGAP